MCTSLFIGYLLTCKNMCRLIKGYKENAACLRQTGGGVGAEEAQEEGSQTVNMAFYIPATGPDCTTVPDTANLWGERDIK
jgi:hypothetical protein